MGASDGDSVGEETTARGGVVVVVAAPLGDFLVEAVGFLVVVLPFFFFKNLTSRLLAVVGFLAIVIVRKSFE